MVSLSRPMHTKWLLKTNSNVAAISCGTDGPSPLVAASGVASNQHEDIKRLLRRNVFGHTSLHLAVNSPKRMKQLLQHDSVKSHVSLRDDSNNLPLYYSSSGACLATAELLLEADSPIDLNILHAASCQEDLMRNLLSHLADRMRRLKLLAERELQSEKLSFLEIPQEHPMDVPCAFHVLKELRAASVAIPHPLVIGGWLSMPNEPDPQYSLFRALPAEARLYESVWKAGFRPIQRKRNISDIFSIPGDLLECVDVLVWIKSKGFRISYEDYHNALVVSHWPNRRYPKKNNLFHSLTHIWEESWDIYTFDNGPDHGCACCLNGCIPALSGFRHLDTSGLECAEEFEGPIEPGFWTWLAPKIIRCYLFDSLELTHSFDCCKRGWQYYHGRDAVEERQEEEWYLRSRLENLIRELSDNFEELNMPLSIFLEEYVRTRAREVLNGEEAPCLETQQRIREIGVILDNIEDK